MRLHRLEATAFGPFAGTVEVDLDRLSEAGLFLLTGPTGAGKTSVLDAVCFALYGDVPGDRASAKRLRCDQAAPGVAPRVELELSLSGRRLRLVRSPAWERPKRRGTGTTTEPAHVVLSERRAGGWEPLSTRLDETGHLLGELLGMNLAQFTQVAMLPQGRFQAFLRARSDERHRLLQQLFRTGRFEEVEAWLKDRRTVLRRASAHVEDQVADLVSRLSESARSEVPGRQDAADGPGGPADLGLLADDGALETWSRSLLAETTTALDRARADAEEAAAAERDAAAVLERGRALRALHERERRADEEQRALEQQAGRHADDLHALHRARRAALVVPLAGLARRAGGELVPLRSQVETASQHARRALGEDHPLDDAVALEDTEQHSRGVVSVLRALEPRVRRLEQQQDRLGELGRAHDDDEVRLTELDDRLEELPQQVARTRESVDLLRAAAQLAPALREQVDATLAQQRAVAEVADLVVQVETARVRWLEGRERAATAHEHLLEVRESRIDSMAAELAAGLAVGDDCPVCGSHEHPAKARPGPGAVDAGVEREAQRALDDAKSHEHVLATHHRDLLMRLEVARERTGGHDETTLRERVRSLETEVAGSEEAARDLLALQARLQALEDEHAAAQSRRSDLLAREAARRATTAALASDAEAASVEVETALDRAAADLGDTAGTTGDGRVPADAQPLARLARLVAAHRARAAAAGDLVRALEALASASAAASAAEASATAAAHEQEFRDVDDAWSAHLDDRAVRTVEQRVGEHERRLARVTEEHARVAAELAETPEALRRAAPDLGVLERTHGASRALLARATSEVSTLEERRGRIEGLAAELDERLQEWAPLRRDLALATRLGSFVEGKHPDNHLQMRLSAYVLAYRLSQVVAAANERLARMSDRRYSLEHTARRGAGETRGGLSLRVRDDWSGEARDPATLSGGETFVVSLALALGLADVITAEAGGAELDTLFVDEGFGSLDAETLEDVMDTLDSLREGGRVVGVVSHVAEMRDRIPTQLRVHKSRDGSSLTVTGATPC